jgi:hypothetical protein
MQSRRFLPALTRLTVAFAALQVGAISTAAADTPAGWISNNNPSAYVLSPGSFAVEGALLRVDDTIDFMDYRDDLLKANSRLTGDSGTLDGNRIDLRVGVWRGLELFYQRQQHDLALEIGPVSRVNIVELNNALDTERTEYGFNWVLYEEGSSNRNSPWRSLSLEVSRIESSSDDFGGKLERMQLSGTTTITFDPPQGFWLNRLKDEGWQARLIASLPLTESTTLSAWGGYGQMESSSGTATEIDLPSVASAFYQTFDAEETLLKAGVALNWQRFARLPVQVGYEYIRINDRDLSAVRSNSTLLPSFLRGNNLTGGAMRNQTAFASVSWWITPQVYVGASGRLFKNQFAGIIPHYNNPLSGRFSDTSYGYAELKVGFQLGRRR